MIENALLDTVWGHIFDLRRVVAKIAITLVTSISLAFFFYQEIFAFLVKPLGGQTLLILSPGEGFITCFKVSFWVGVLGSSPIWGCFLLQFVLPALKENEKAKVTPFLLISFACLLLGLLAAFFVGIPLANQALAEFNKTLGENFWSLSSYIDYTLTLLLSSAFAFEIAGIGFLLVHMGVFSVEMLCKRRREVVVVTFILGAVLTPPDVFTQGVLAGVLLIFYELAILYAKWKGRSG